MTPSRSQWLALSVILVMAPPLRSQEPQPVILKPVNGSVAFPFKNVVGVRELRDHTVLLYDPPGSGIVLGDFAKHSGRAVMRMGAGDLFALSFDSTLAQDRMSQRWTLLVDAKPVGTLDATTPVVATTSLLYGADTAGYVLASGVDPHPVDSSVVSLVNRGTGDHVPVMTLAYPASVSAGAGDEYPVYERAALGVDGWIAVLRMNPYRVDWRRSDGSWIRGAPIPYAVLPTDEQERKAYASWLSHGSKTALDPRRRVPDSAPPWISRIGTLSMLSADGKVVVERIPTADAPFTRYDVIDRQGVRERQLKLAANESIVGFGPSSVYVRTIGTDGWTVRVERHPWP